MLGMNIKKMRNSFPITKREFSVVGGGKKRLVYLDHAASTHPPIQVMNAVQQFLSENYSNIHRGNHYLSVISSEIFDETSKVIADFVGANRLDNAFIMTNNATTALDIASYAMSREEGIVLSTEMEHHSNDLTHRRRGTVRYVNILEDGQLDMEDLEKKMHEKKVKLVAVTGASNVTGFMPDIHRIASIAHDFKAKILVDGAQLFAHHSIDVKEFTHSEHIDFLACAGHKAYAPYGSAFLMAPKEFMNAVSPYIPGGGTVSYVSLAEAIWLESRDRHQGGTPNIAGALALSSAIQFLKRVGMDTIREHEKNLFKLALRELEKISGLTVYGPKNPEQCTGIVALNVDGVHHELVSAVLNYEGAIATRNGCFCAHPYLQRLFHITDREKFKMDVIQGKKITLPGAVRASVGVYTTKNEVKEFAEWIRIVSKREWKGRYVPFQERTHIPEGFELPIQDITVMDTIF